MSPLCNSQAPHSASSSCLCSDRLQGEGALLLLLLLLCNQSSGSILPGPCRTHLPWRCCTAGSRQSGQQRRSPQHGLVQPGRKQTGLDWVTDLDQGATRQQWCVSLNRLDHMSIIILHSLLLTDEILTGRLLVIQPLSAASPPVGLCMRRSSHQTPFRKRLNIEWPCMLARMSTTFSLILTSDLVFDASL